MPIAKFGERTTGSTGWVEVHPVNFIFELEDSFEHIGDRDRTAGGNMRQDTITTKRNWRISTRRMTHDEAYDLINYLRDRFFVVGDFWLDEFGAEANTVSAYIPPEDIRANRASFYRDGVFHNDGKELTLRVVER